LDTNLIEIDELVETFISNNYVGISSVYKSHHHNYDQLSIKSFIESIKDDLKTGCVSFVNKNNSTKDLDSYLFYIVNSLSKRTSDPIKKKTEYICPGCLSLGNITLLRENSSILYCDDCAHLLNECLSIPKIEFHKRFAIHNKRGVRCPDCNKFIPLPLNNSTKINCPYFNCCFVGDSSNLDKMHHPSSRTNPEILTLDSLDNFIKDSIDESISISEMEVVEDINEKIILIKDAIETLCNAVNYTSSDFTKKHKILIYNAFSNLLEREPQDLVGYLLYNSRTGGFQHKIFQEYIRLLELELPYSYKKGNKIYCIKSLLDDNLNLFDGISTFEGVVDCRHEIKNNTKEFYIGGRKASYSKPYYIGKLLDVYLEDQSSILNKVKQYSFLKIKVAEDIPENTKIFVKHLRVPPHYCSNGMSNDNRIRKKIVDKLRSN
jgi:ribosomal protein L37AE/L43A